MVKFYLDKELFTEDYRETAINYLAYHAVRNREETGNALLDFNDVIYDRDIPEIVDTLKRMHETEFTISSTFSSLISTLAGFDKLGAKISGIVEINSVSRDLRTGEHERIPALLMKLD